MATLFELGVSSKEELAPLKKLAEMLPDGWVLTTSTGDWRLERELDSVLFCPFGVFYIELKNWKTKLTAAPDGPWGRKANFFRQGGDGAKFLATFFDDDELRYGQKGISRPFKTNFLIVQTHPEGGIDLTQIEGRPDKKAGVSLDDHIIDRRLDLLEERVKVFPGWRAAPLDPCAYLPALVMLKDPMLDLAAAIEKAAAGFVDGITFPAEDAWTAVRRSRPRPGAAPRGAPSEVGATAEDTLAADHPTRPRDSGFKSFSRQVGTGPTPVPRPNWTGRIVLAAGALVLVLFGFDMLNTGGSGRAPARQAPAVSTPAPAVRGDVIGSVVELERGYGTPFLVGRVRDGRQVAVGTRVYVVLSGRRYDFRVSRVSGARFSALPAGAAPPELTGGQQVFAMAAR